MIRLAKLTDYGIALMSHVARSQAPATMFSARELALATRIPLPTVSKLLKLLSAGGLLHSQRGVHGGYSLVRAPVETTVADVIAALEGPLSLTECESAHSTCSIEHACRVRPHWRKINLAVRTALNALTLADMAKDTLPEVPLVRPRSRRTQGAHP